MPGTHNPLPSMLRVLAQLDPGHAREHRRILAGFNSQAGQRQFVREILVDCIFARAERQAWAKRAASEWAALLESTKRGTRL